MVFPRRMNLANGSCGKQHSNGSMLFVKRAATFKLPKAMDTSLIHLLSPRTSLILSNSRKPNHQFESEKRSQLFIRVYDKTLSIVAMTATAARMAKNFAKDIHCVLPFV